MTDFTRTIPGDGCLDLSLTVESGQPRSAASQEEQTDE